MAACAALSRWLMHLVTSFIYSSYSAQCQCCSMRATAWPMLMQAARRLPAAIVHCIARDDIPMLLVRDVFSGIHCWALMRPQPLLDCPVHCPGIVSGLRIAHLTHASCVPFSTSRCCCHSASCAAPGVPHPAAMLSTCPLLAICTD